MNGPSKVSSNSLLYTTAASKNTIRPRCRIAQTCRVIWVDATIDSNDIKCKKILRCLHKVVSDVSFFKRKAECIEFLNKMKDEKAFIITSESLGQQLVNDIHKMPQVDVIYIVSDNKAHHEHWTEAWSKIRGVFTSIKSICESMREVVREIEHDSIPMSFVSEETMTAVRCSNEQDLDQLDPTYMYSIIFKNIILEIDDDDDKQMETLVTYCREQKASERQLNDFQLQYQQKSPVWWYTKEIFLYRMVNKALRTFDMKGMVKIGFFIRHLNLKLKQLHEEQAAQFKEQFIVYRGQGLCPEDFQNLLNTKGGLLSFNSFLSTSRNGFINLVSIFKGVLAKIRKNSTLLKVL